MSSKGQQHSRQPVSRVKGRETSQPRNPAGHGQPGGSSFIKSKTPKGRRPDFGAPATGKPAGSAPRGAAPHRGEPGPRTPGAPQQPATPHRNRTAQSATQPQPAAPHRNRTAQSATQPQPAAPHRNRTAQSAPQPQQGPHPAQRTAPKAARAKKMVLREPAQEIVDRSRRLREARVDTSRIEPVRLQKALSQSGVGSRREMEEWIEAGLVLVNGKKAVLGDKVGPQDRITVKGNPIKLKWSDRLPRVILYYKQEGEIVSRDDPEGRVTIFDRLPQAKSSRWVTIGRLDANTSGLLILTTSGELANRMMHPSFEVEREYAVRVLGALTDEQRRVMSDEVLLDDGPAHFERITDQGGEGANHWYRVVIKEGRNREVRRMFEHYDLPVSRLIRLRFGKIGLPPRLKRGQFYELNEVEVAAVMKWSDLTFSGAGRR